MLLASTVLKWGPTNIDCASVKQELRVATGVVSNYSACYGVLFTLRGVN